MGTTKPPKGKEWDKIVDEAFSSNELHTFSDNYRRRRAALERGVIMKKDDTMKRINPKSKRHYTGAAAIAAAVLLVPTVTIAGLRMNSGSKKADPSPKAQVDVEVEATSTELLINEEDAEFGGNEVVDVTEENAESVSSYEDEDLGEESTAAEDNGEAEDVAYSLLEAVDDHDVEYTYIPDGYETDGPYEGKFHKLGASGGITPCGLAKTSYFDKYIATFTDENAAPDINPEMLPRTADAPYEVITSDENTPDVEVYVFNRNVPDNLDENDRTAGYFNRDVVLRFKDTDYVEFMFVHSFVTQEELDSFIKGIKISPAINID